MIDLWKPVPETVTVRPGLACSISGLTPYELTSTAMVQDIDNPAFIRAIRIGNVTEYRLDDILALLGAMSAIGHDDEETP